MRRIVSVWLIDWPIAVWRRSAMRARRPASPPDPALDPQTPFALIRKNSRGAAILYALNPPPGGPACIVARPVPTPGP